MSQPMDTAYTGKSTYQWYLLVFIVDFDNCFIVYTVATLFSTKISFRVFLMLVFTNYDLYKGRSLTNCSLPLRLVKQSTQC